MNTEIPTTLKTYSWAFITKKGPRHPSPEKMRVVLLVPSHVAEEVYPMVSRIITERFQPISWRSVKPSRTLGKDNDIPTLTITWKNIIHDEHTFTFEGYANPTGYATKAKQSNAN